MGLIRCPKCDAICHTEEETCHYCGYRLKPEVKKEEPIADSELLDEKTEKVEAEEDPFATFGYKEDPFDDFEKQIKEEKKEETRKTSPVAKNSIDSTTGLVLRVSSFFSSFICFSKSSKGSSL